MFSCASPEDGASDGLRADDPPNENTHAGETSEDRSYIDDLPEMDFNSGKFTILTFTFDNANTNMVPEEQIGEPVIDAIYLSNSIVQERFNVEIEQIAVPDWGNMGMY